MEISDAAYQNLEQHIYNPLYKYESYPSNKIYEEENRLNYFNDNGILLKILTSLFVVFLFTIISGISYAKSDPYKSKRTYRGHLFNIPVYDTNSKSYFKLVSVKHGHYRVAMSYARSQRYKGARGRLAVIKSKETQEFIDDVFRPPDETWIGLRMWCRPRKVFWVTGETLKRGKDYANWGRSWHYKRKYYPCKDRSGPNRDFAGIGLVRYQGKIRWWAMAPRHETTALLIEFPTGKP